MINYITAPFRWFFKLEAASGLILLLAAIVALVLSNTNFSDLLQNIEHSCLNRYKKFWFRFKYFTLDK